MDISIPAHKVLGSPNTYGSVIPYGITNGVKANIARIITIIERQLQILI